MEHPFVGIVDDLHFTQHDRFGVFIESDMLPHEFTDLRIALLGKHLAAGQGMIFPGFKAAGFGDIMQQGGSLNEIEVESAVLPVQVFG
jgi:hypothetical protein